MDSVVLLLNSDYEPLNVCDVRRAFRLVFGEKAEVIQYDHHEIRTPTRDLPRAERHPPPAPHQAPAAARAPVAARGLRARPAHVPVLRRADARPDARPRRAAPPRRCAHLGQPGRRVQGAATTARAARLLDEARMRLLRAPFEPRCDVYTLFTPYLADPRNEAWRDYLFLGRN